MKLTDLVATHGYVPSDLGEIDKAKLYQRQNSDGVTELLCVQKIGYLFRVDIQAMMIIGNMMIPLGSALHNKMIHKDDLEKFLNGILSQPVAI